MLESEGEAPLRPVLPFNQCLKEEIKVQKAIIGKKIGMTQIFDETGKVIPVTVIEAGPCTVVQKKTAEKDGYDSVQLGFCDVNEKKMTKPAKGHFEKAGVAPKKYLKEFRLDDCAAHNVGDTILADVFVAGEKIDVTISASDLCDILKAQFNGGYTYTNGATGDSIKWESSGYVNKAAIQYVIKEAN